MSASALTPFDIAGELPTGTVLLEASAGTGKTWTIGALVARHALCVGSVLIFVAAFGGLAPVYVPALSTPALIAFALWCALVLALMLTTAARVTARLVLGTTRAARSAWRAPASDPR